MNRLLIVDGQNLAYRAQYKFNLSTPSGESSSVAYGFIYILQSLIRRFKPNSVWVIFDGGRSTYRMRIHPGYKDRGDKLGEDKIEFYSQIDSIIQLLSALNCNTIRVKGEEADDFIYYVVRKHLKDYKLIVSSDKDFAQLISKRTHIYNPFKDKTITKDNIKEVYGFSEKEIVDYLCLKGDKSDRIKGARGLGDKRIRQFLDEFGSIENYLLSDSTNWTQYPIEEVYTLNRQLIDLRYYYNTYLKGKEWDFIKPSWDKKIIKEFIYHYKTGTFYRKDFLKTFKTLI